MAAPGSEPRAGPATSDPSPASTSPPIDTAESTAEPTSSNEAANGPTGEPSAKTVTDEHPAKQNPSPQPEKAPAASMAVDLDDFGLPIRKYVAPPPAASEDGRSVEEKPRSHQGSDSSRTSRRDSSQGGTTPAQNDSGTSDNEFVDAVASQADHDANGPLTPMPTEAQKAAAAKKADDAVTSKPRSNTVTSNISSATSGAGAHGVSEFSHQHTLKQEDTKEDNADEGWQEMPAYARYDMYNDDDKLIAKEHHDEEDEKYGYGDLGGAGKGYTRVIMDDDAESATSMDDNTQYLFNNVKSTSMMDEDDAEQRDAVSQMQATKDLLTEGQRIAYVGIVRLELYGMVKDLEDIPQNKKTKKWLTFAAEAMKMHAQKMMIRLYTHMDISPAEQVMIEQLVEHGVMPADLTPTLMANSTVNNPMAEKSPRSSTAPSTPVSVSTPTSPSQEEAAQPPPPYEEHEGEELPDVRTPSQLPTSSKLDIDLRWTVLCDLFLVLIADSNYDARSRCVLERVAKAMNIPWMDICRFEKRVTDALEMQQAAEKENWNEDEHMEERRKMALKRRYMMMGLATVGGGLVIGLSAGLLAPVIGAGLAAGFTTIGVGGTSGFLAGAGGAAVITSSAAASGSIIGVRAANRRTGAVKTFEYRPLHNNKRVNLVITVSGWMTGKVDDVRLPYSTVDSVMGDIYSVLWEPEMLRSMGDTINILATEVSREGNPHMHLDNAGANFLGGSHPRLAASAWPDDSHVAHGSHPTARHSHQAVIPY